MIDAEVPTIYLSIIIIIITIIITRERHWWDRAVIETTGISDGVAVVGSSSSVGRCA